MSTSNPTVQALISRRQDDQKAEENLIWLRNATNAPIHADLIVGLPGEDVESFRDYEESGLKGCPRSFKQHGTRNGQGKAFRLENVPARQARHIRN